MRGFFFIMAGGRPPHFKTAEELEKAIRDYLDSSPAPNMAGLALALGFLSRTSIFDYENRGAKFSNVIKKARLAIEADKLEKFTTGDYNTAAVIFTLTNNHGYQNTRNVDHTTKGEKVNTGFKVEIVDSNPDDKSK